ncbi:DegT/DnrJ/EryC1/StrS aminotransferase family protein [uncultured Desulfobacter sp.]|uniref:DegT/DnrJ/EryC1/StrS family aminotransferase n=1 Tax=uncultured Desulfobacter sp. TaxID=240139 RepID=UPI0029F5A309|nr:DegT/DnrJ/EryC1/StrS aminotransferase family protein [uncultured Desulfobacter sp.]
MEFSPWPNFEEDEIQSAVNVLKTGKVNQWTGHEVGLFEKEFGDYTGTHYAVALANGSLALDLALEALDVGRGDEVIVTPRSFLASVSCVCLRGAVPVFVDVDLESQNITAENIELAVTDKTKAIVAVNLAGWPCEISEILEICRYNGIGLVEDCAQSHGASTKKVKVGSMGDVGVFSFCQDKIMTTGGEGGLLVTNNKNIRDRVWSYKDHGKDFKESTSSQSSGSIFKWLAKSFGTNCRMTEMQAAIGRKQLKKLDKWIDKRRYYAELFNQSFSKLPGLRTTIPPKHIYHSYYKYYVFVRPDALKTGWPVFKILDALREKGIFCNSGICPEIYRERAFHNYPFRVVASGKKVKRLPNARLLGKTSMMFQVHPTLTTKHIEYMIDQVEDVLTRAVR